MQDVDLEVELGQSVHDRSREERVLLALELAAAIHRTAEVELVVDEVIRHAVDHELLEAHVLRTPTQARLEIA